MGWADCCINTIRKCPSRFSRHATLPTVASGPHTFDSSQIRALGCQKHGVPRVKETASIRVLLRWSNKQRLEAAVLWSGSCRVLAFEPLSEFASQFAIPVREYFVSSFVTQGALL